MVSMQSLPKDYRAVVAGSTGGIGAAFVKLLNADENCAEVIEFSRSTWPAINFDNEETIKSAAQSIKGDIHLFVDATGFLADEIIKPEKSLKTLDAQNMTRLFQLNAMGPALLMKHFTPLMPRKERAIFATLSARVGSIGDNSLGGWYSYRASKSALNMFLKCTAIELARNKTKSICVALHPGTVETSLSDPFASDRTRFTPDHSASQMLQVLDGLNPEQTGTFWDYKGDAIEW
jgi:NAD(P)-dependent dehydrogenase (short-subunit alcohol dehydrogenase family)